MGYPKVTSHKTTTVTFIALNMLLMFPSLTFGQSSKIDSGAEKVTPVIHGLAIPEDEVPKLEEEALAGSVKAALRLHLYYEMAHVDLKESLFWAGIAAENGSPVAQYNLGLKLQKEPDKKNRKRGKFWLEQAAKNGDEAAIELLKTLRD